MPEGIYGLMMTSWHVAEQWLKFNESHGQPRYLLRIHSREAKYSTLLIPGDKIANVHGFSFIRA